MMMRKRFGVIVVLLFLSLFLVACKDDVTFTVVFEPNGGSLVSDQVVQEGDRLEEPETTKEGYTLGGWYTSLDDGVTLDEHWSFTFSVVPSDLTLYAKWTPNTYEVTFEGQEADGGDPLNRMVVTYDQPYGALPVPTRTGHAFLGWLKDTGDDVFVDEDYVVDMAEDHILLAIWQVNTYTISFNSNDGSSVDPITQDYGTEIMEPVPTRSGHTFTGWYLDENLTIPSGFETMPAQDFTLHAKWELTDYDISYHLDGGNNHPDNPNTYRMTTPTIELEHPNKEGHTFLGWYDNAEMTEETHSIDIGSTGDKVLYAKWQINSYTLSFDSNQGSAVSPITQEYGTELTEPATPERIGHTFLGWYRDEGLSVLFEFDRMPAEDMMLHAKWDVKAYTITFDSNGGSDIPSLTQDYDTVVIVPDEPLREGYTFVGWYEDEAFQEIHTFDRMPATDMTLYALWHNTITFETDGGSFIEPITMLAGEEIEMTEHSLKEGHAFKGWFTDIGFTEEFVFSTMPDQNITVYAKWEVMRYNVTFDTNGGEPMDSLVLDYGTPLADYRPSREGYVFGGWYYGEAFYYEISSIPSEDIILHARWELIDMVQVGERGTTYTFPTDPFYSGTASADGGYFMATTETTYELWYAVRIWAGSNGYHFQNQGREGNDGIIGAAPTEDRFEPVTTISWVDVVVWMNAASERAGYDPVYRTANGDIIRDSRDANLNTVMNSVQTDNNGYRLPMTNEWRMASRWRNGSGDGSVLVGGRYWTPGSYASGATDYHGNPDASNEVAWYVSNSGDKTHPVGEKAPNHLGIHDMSGNVWEWIYESLPDFLGGRSLRGGSYAYSAFHMQIGNVGDDSPNETFVDLGFRIVREW